MALGAFYGPHDRVESIDDEFAYAFWCARTSAAML
jgi:hypothetical protein